MQMVLPPNCGTKLLGQPLCDSRALGQPSVSGGGVKCTCVGEGLGYHPGVPADGQRCQQQTSIKVLTQTSHVTMSVQKPSFRAGAVAVVFAAAGEIGFNASYNVSMIHVRPSDGMPRLQGSSSAARGWSKIDQERMSMDGHHIIWERTPPSVDGAVDLSFDAGKFSFSQTFGLAIELNCTEGEPCVEDGDTVNTVVTAVAASDGLVSAVMISTTVESLVSCEHSTVWVEVDVVPISTTIRVRFFAKDVDKLPVRFTRAEINLVFAGRRIAVEWSRGSNEYVADVPAELTGKPGLYDLVLSVSNAWNRTAGQATSCELLRRAIAVKEGLSSNWIVAGAGSAAIVIVGGTVILVRRRHAHLQAIMAMIFTEVSPALEVPELPLELPCCIRFRCPLATLLCGGLLVV
jgi:hypothetical protein